MAQSVLDGGYADVAPAGFSFTVAADAPIISASLSVFADADATTDVSGSLTVSTTPGFGPAELDAGLVSLRVRGAMPQMNYYARLTLDIGAGPVDYPPNTPLTAVQTSKPLALLESGGVMQFNALASETAVQPASLSLLSHSGSPYPISSHPASGPHAFDLNNLKNGSGDTLAIATGNVVTVQEWLGVTCAGRPGVARTRQVPDATAGGTLQFTALTRCFFADTNCDATVDVLDLQYLLAFFPSNTASCGFNDDIDADVSGAIDVIDLQALLNRFGDVAPF